MIKINNVSKTFRKKIALDSVSLEIESGKIYGLLGKNGAGKTTLIRSISNKLFNDSGTIHIDGQEVNNNLRLQDYLYVMSNSEFSTINGRVEKVFERISSLNPHFNYELAISYLERFRINPSSYYLKLSTGNKTNFKLIIALAMDLPYIIFDEPTIGLDPNNRSLFYKILIERYIELSNTIIISTHLISDLENILEELIIIDNGKIILARNIEDLLAEADNKSLSQIFIDKVGGLKNER